MRRFPLSKKFIDWDRPLINKFVFKKLILQFFNHCFISSFIKFVAMILLQILKSIKTFLVSIIILLSVKKEVMSNTIGNFISNNVKEVVIGFWGLKSLHIIDRKSDENGRILIIDAKVKDKKFLLVNLYNPNTESEQTKTLDTLKNLFEDIDNISDKK